MIRRIALVSILVSLLALGAHGQGSVSGTGKISGTGSLTIVPFPSITVSPASLAFGSIVQNTTSASQAVTIQNVGTTTLTFVSISVSAQYTIATNCGATLAGAANCIINVTFAPTAVGAIPGTLTINDNAPGTPQTVPLTGTGLSNSPPIATLTPTSLTFGTQVAGTTSASQGVVLQNTGGSTLTVSSIVASTQFGQLNNCPASLAAAASCTINVTFSPTGAGTTSGTVTVTDNASGSPHVIALTGQAISASIGPLVASAINNHYAVTPGGRAVYLVGSHTWNDFDDTSTTCPPAAFNFNQFVSMLVANKHSATILWHKDLPKEFSWQNSSNYCLSPQPWVRSSTPGASDGGNKFDLSTFNQSFFDRMRSEALTLQSNGIYAIVELFDGNNLTSTRGGTNTAPNGDGFPLTGVNNINGVNDGYTGSGNCGVQAFTMTTNNAVTAIQDAYVKKMLDTLNDLQNVIYEVAEEQPGASFSTCSGGWGGAASTTFWAPHMMGLVKAYEKGGTFETITYPGKPLQHLVGIGSMNFNDRIGGDAILYGLASADWIGPTVTASAPDTFPSNVATNNQGKLVINDSDHALGPSAFVNASTGAIDDVHLRDYVWENFTQQAWGQVFMDPYDVSLPNNQRNPCASPVGGICPNSMTKYDPFRAAMGYTQNLLPQLVNLLLMTTQNSLCSTSFCMANNSATSSEFVVYAPVGGTFTVNLSAQANRFINVQWLNPTTGVLTAGTQVTGGGATTSFTPPWGSTNDAVLHLTDGGSSVAGSGLFPVVGAFTQLVGTKFSTIAPAYPEVQGNSGTAAIFSTWTTGLWDPGSYNRQARRFLHQGGGHNDWYGNEVEMVDLFTGTAVSSLLKDATHNPSFAANNTESQLIAVPTARHHYDGFLFDAQLDKYWLMGNFLSAGGQGTSRVWTLDPETLTSNGNDPTGWALLAQPSPHPDHALSGGEPHFVYDPGNETIAPGIFEIENITQVLWRWDGVGNVWTNQGTVSPSTICTNNPNLTTAFDFYKREYYCLGNGSGGPKMQKIKIDSPFTSTNLTATGCSTPKSAQAPGFVFYPPMRQFVLYAGGNTVYRYDPNTDACTPVVLTGTVPTTNQSAGGGCVGGVCNGTFGNLQYDTADGVFIIANSVGEDNFGFRLDSNATLQAADWAARNSAAGVVTARGFDSPSDFTVIGNNAGGLHAAGGAPSRFMVQDTITYTSGGSSMLCTIPLNIGPDGCGSWWEILNTTFGANSTWYVSYRLKVDQAWKDEKPTAGGSPANFKTSIFAFYSGTPPNGSPNTCGPTELTTVNLNNNGYPAMYTDCGAPTLEINMNNGDFLKEQGDNSTFLGAAQDTGFNCHYQAVNNNAKSCAQWPAGVWVTYYWKIQLGAVNTSSPCSCNTIQAWRALPGQQYQEWVNVSNFPLQLTAGSTGWNFIDLIPGYSTARDSQLGTLPGHAWLDELLVSTTPQAPPMAPVN